jgi:hypothetical protein
MRPDCKESAGLRKLPGNRLFLFRRSIERC